MDFRPKNYYHSCTPVTAKPVRVKEQGTNVFYRKEDGKLGHFNWHNSDHKEAILSVKEVLVAEGDCLTNKAVLAVIKGGINAV